jgi:tripartite-type tricarboxylate transporter receptor subunit TctC
MKVVKYLVVGLLCVLISAACGGTSSSPSSQSTSYEDGDVVTVVVGTDPGGGFDTQARLLQPYLEDALQQLTEADVTAVVENRPGAAHQLAMEYVNMAPPDGTTFVFTSAQLAVTTQVVKGANFDLLDMTSLGSAGRLDRAIAVSSTLELPEPTFNGLIARSQEQPILMSHPSLDADVALMVALLRDAGATLDVDAVPMGDTPEQMASLLRAEIEAVMTTGVSMKPFVEDNPEAIEFLASLGCEEQEQLPDVSTVVAQGVPNAEEICRAVGGDDRVFFGPPGMVEERLSVLRDALELALTNDEYIEEVTDAALVGEYEDAEEVGALFEDLIATYRDYEEELDVQQ